MMNPDRLKNYYEILAIDPLSSPEEIKRAFRTHIALSHPDKVSHLAKEIQELASMRTAELTEAYRVLSNAKMRSDYDRQLQNTVKSMASANGQEQRSRNGEPSGKLGKDTFLYKTGLARLKDAVLETFPGMQEMQWKGFDAAFVHRRKWNLLGPGRGCTQVFVRALPLVDSQAVEDGWHGVCRTVSGIRGDIYLFLMGIELDSPAKLSTTILFLQRRTRLQNQTRILVVPLNVNSFAPMIPSGAPDSLRAIIRALKN
jgi:curved DNA-binding protein CbpA